MAFRFGFNPCPGGGIAMPSAQCIVSGGYCQTPAVGLPDNCCCVFPPTVTPPPSPAPPIVFAPTPSPTPPPPPPPLPITTSTPPPPIGVQRLNCQCQCTPA